jgi:hypothetical protein
MLTHPTRRRVILRPATLQSSSAECFAGRRIFNRVSTCVGGMHQLYRRIWYEAAGQTSRQPQVISPAAALCFIAGPASHVAALTIDSSAELPSRALQALRRRDDAERIEPGAAAAEHTPWGTSTGHTTAAAARCYFIDSSTSHARRADRGRSRCPAANRMPCSPRRRLHPDVAR